MDYDFLKYSRSDPLMDDDRLKEYLAKKLREGDDRMSNIEMGMQDLRLQVAANTTITATGNADVAQVLEILRAGRGGLKVLGVIGSIVKWTAGVAGACVALYGMATGKLPWGGK